MVVTGKAIVADGVAGEVADSVGVAGWLAMGVAVMAETTGVEVSVGQGVGEGGGVGGVQARRIPDSKTIKLIIQMSFMLDIDEKTVWDGLKSVLQWNLKTKGAANTDLTFGKHFAPVSIGDIFD